MQTVKTSDDFNPEVDIDHISLRRNADLGSRPTHRSRKTILGFPGDIFERLPSPDQDLMFTDLSAQFQKQGLILDEEDFEDLELVSSSDHTYTNLARLLSDQNSSFSQVAVFKDPAMTVVRKVKLFKGSLIDQMERLLEYVDSLVMPQVETESDDRKEFGAIPKNAVREAVVNAFVHRNYRLNGPILVNISDQAFQATNLGSLPNDLSLNELSDGVSCPRNPNLFRIFSLLNLNDGSGFGISTIRQNYEGFPETPELYATKQSFRIVLPILNHPGSEMKASSV